MSFSVSFRIDARAERLGRPFDDVAKLGLVHRPEADLALLHRDAQAVVVLDVRIEIRARARDQRAGRLGRRFENEVDEQLGVRGARFGPRRSSAPAASPGCKAPPIDRHRGGGACCPLVLQPVADELRQR